MKATELMIGDWVYFYDTTFSAQIKMIDPQCVYIDSVIESAWLKEQNINPIPITKENLILNGLVCAVEDDDSNHYIYEMYFNNQYLLVCFDQDTTWAEIIHDDKDRRYSGTLKYIHELQHALRLCGLDELADNFKVTDGE